MRVPAPIVQLTTQSASAQSLVMSQKQNCSVISGLFQKEKQIPVFFKTVAASASFSFFYSSALLSPVPPG